MLDADEYESCRGFVVEAALHLASKDFDLDLGALWRATQNAAQSSSA